MGRLRSCDGEAPVPPAVYGESDGDWPKLGSDILYVFFDVDGTLSLSDHLHLLAFQKLCKRENCDHAINEAFFNKHISGRHNDDIVEVLFPSWPKDKKTAFAEEKEELFRTMCRNGGADRLPGLREVNGAAAFLNMLKAHAIPSAAVTNAPRLNGELMLESLGFLSHFLAPQNAGVVYGSECSRAKPFPDPYLEAMRRSGLIDGVQERAIVDGSADAATWAVARKGLALEDSPAGVSAAAAAGLTVVGLTTGHSSHTLRAAGAHFTCSDYHELMVQMCLVNRFNSY